MKHFQQTQIVKIVAKTMHKKIPFEDKIGIVIGTNTFCEQTYDGKLFLCIKSKDFYYILVLKTLLLQGLSEPEFYGDLVYKFRKIIGKIDFPYHFKKIIVRYKKIGYNINVMRQTACLVVNPIKVNSFAYLFNCTTVGRTSD